MKQDDMESVRARPNWLPIVGVACIAAMISLLLTISDSIGIVVAIFGATMAVLIGGLALIILLRRPALGLMLLALLLPFHTFILLLTVGYLGLPIGVGRAFQVWKELLIILLLVLAVIYAKGRFRLHIRLLDWFMLAFLALQLCYAIVPSQYTTMIGVLYGIRNNSIFIAAYLVGRLIQIDERQAIRLTNIVLGVAVVVSLLAIVEIFVAPADTLLRLGFVRYHTGLLGTPLPSAARFMSLPSQLYAEFTAAGRHIMVRRAGSTYVNSVVFSFTQLIAVPIMMNLVLERAWPRSRIALLAIAGLGTILGITRSALLGLIIATAFIVTISILRGRLPKILLWLMVLSTPLIVAVGFQLGIHHLVLNTLRLQDSSSQVHLSALLENVQLTAAQPWGYGIGASGTAAHRSTVSLGSGGESWYFQMILQMGLLGGFIAVFIILFSLGALWQAYRQLDDNYLRATALGLLASGIGFAVASNLLHTWDYLQVAIPYWLLVGVILQQHDRAIFRRRRKRSAMNIADVASPQEAELTCG